MRRGRTNDDVNPFESVAETRERVLDEVLPTESGAEFEERSSPKPVEPQTTVERPKTAQAPKVQAPPAEAASPRNRLADLEARLAEEDGGAERQLGARIPDWLYREMEDAIHELNRRRPVGRRSNKVTKESWVVRAIILALAEDAVG